MLLFNTVKRLGTGLFGSAFLIVKDVEKNRFVSEIDSNIPEGHKNMYVLKRITFSDHKEELYRNLLNQSTRPTVLHEIRANTILSHPNISEFYGSYSTNYFVTFINEYLCCGTLEHICNNSQPINEIYKTRIMFYSAQVLLALEYLHGLDIYHGDVSQRNFCLDYRGYAKLIDFGSSVTGDEPFSQYNGSSNNFVILFVIVL